MSRKKRLLLNTTTALLHQIITVVCGFILPRLLLSYFGSQVNGLVSSISQFLAFISFADLDSVYTSYARTPAQMAMHRT